MNKENIKKTMCKHIKDRIVELKKERYSLRLGNHDLRDVDLLICQLKIEVLKIKCGERDEDFAAWSE